MPTINWKDMLKANGTAGALTNGKVGVNAIDQSGATLPPIFKQFGAMPNLPQAIKEYPPTQKEMVQRSIAGKVCEDNVDLINRLKSDAGQKLDPASAEQKQLINDVRDVLKVPKVSNSSVYLRNNSDSGNVEIIVGNNLTEKPEAKLVFSPNSRQIVSVTDTEAAKISAEIGRSTFAVLDRDKAIFDKIKGGDMQALSSVSAELGKAAGLREGEKFEVSYQPFKRNITLPDGKTIHAETDSILFKQPTGNLIQVARARDEAGKPIETAYQVNPGFISLGAMRNNLPK